MAAENALAEQSKKHSDGWGLAYYVDRYPHLIRNDLQALKDDLFSALSAVVATRTFMAHIRRATVGAAAVLNCHPFQYGSWTFGHNGEIAAFRDTEVQKRLRRLVDRRFARYLLGNTDSEMVFFIFLSQLARAVGDVQHEGVSVEECISALSTTLSLIREAAPDRDTGDDSDVSKLNVLITNANMMIAYHHGLQLNYSTHKTHCPERNSCPAYSKELCETPVESGPVNHLIISSEPIVDNHNVWVTMEDEDYVCVDHAMRFRHGTLKF